LLKAIGSFLLKFWTVLKQAASDFIDDNGIKLSAALSYYTLFAIGPFLILIISLVGIFYGKEAIRGKVYYELNSLVGDRAAEQIQVIIQNIEQSQLSTSGAIVGSVVLLIGATGIFTEIQDSMNFILSIKAKPKKGWLKLIINRLISFSLIVSIGFLMLVTLMLNTIVDVLQDHLNALFPELTVHLLQITNTVMLLMIITVLFTIIFRVLPDAKIAWRDSFYGALFTTVLFLLGKFCIGLYISYSKIGITYGAATSVVLLLIWVYYTSIILYFGGEFMKNWAMKYGKGIVPNDTAVFIVKQESREIDTNRSVN
jgi:membrane protein